MFGVEPCHYTGAQSDNPANGFKLLKTTSACLNASVTSELSPDKRKESTGCSHKVDRLMQGGRLISSTAHPQTATVTNSHRIYQNDGDIYFKSISFLLDKCLKFPVLNFLAGSLLTWMIWPQLISKIGKSTGWSLKCFPLQRIQGARSQEPIKTVKNNPKWLIFRESAVCTLLYGVIAVRSHSKPSATWKVDVSCNVFKVICWSFIFKGFLQKGCL